MFCLLFTSLLFGFRLHREDRGSMCLRNVGMSPHMYTASQPSRPPQWNRTRGFLRCGRCSLRLWERYSIAARSVSYVFIIISWNCHRLPCNWTLQTNQALSLLARIVHTVSLQSSSEARGQSLREKHITTLQEFTQAGQNKILGPGPLILKRYTFWKNNNNNNKKKEHVFVHKYNLNNLIKI
jgi:hypothetical protein